MGEIKPYFFDSYALYELLVFDNENYKPYAENISIVTTKMNLMEFHYGLLLKYGKEIADKYFSDLTKFCINIDDGIIILANEFRVSMKKRKLSYIDCLGYAIALSMGIKFLTGDQGFKDLENVEYVK